MRRFTDWDLCLCSVTGPCPGQGPMRSGMSYCVQPGRAMGSVSLSNRLFPAVGCSPTQCFHLHLTIIMLSGRSERTAATLSSLL